MNRNLNKPVAKYILSELLAGNRVAFTKKHPNFSEIDILNQIVFLKSSLFIKAELIKNNRSANNEYTAGIATSINQSGMTLYNTL